MFLYFLFLFVSNFFFQRLQLLCSCFIWMNPAGYEFPTDMTTVPIAFFFFWSYEGVSSCIDMSLVV